MGSKNRCEAKLNKSYLICNKQSEKSQNKKRGLSRVKEVLLIFKIGVRLKWRLAIVVVVQNDDYTQSIINYKQLHAIIKNDIHDSLSASAYTVLSQEIIRSDRQLLPAIYNKTRLLRCQLNFRRRYVQ